MASSSDAPSPIGGDRTAVRIVDRMLAVDMTAGDVDADLLALCRIWREELRAPDVGLWLFNPYSLQYELASFVGTTSPALSRAMDQIAANQRGLGIGHCCNAIGRAVFVEDVSTWNATVGGATYRCQLEPMLTKRGLRAILAIPLLDHGGEKGGMAPLLCAYYATAPPTPAVDLDALTLLGRAARRFIEISRTTQHHVVQRQLFKLTHEALSSTHPRPQRTFDRFMASLRDVIARTLHVRGVTIFVHDPVVGVLRGAATTGLVSQSGEAIGPDDVDRAVYAKGEGRTWRCFESNRPITYGTEAVFEPGVFKYSEKHLDDRSRDSFLLHPIPEDPSVEPGAGRAIGVLRCIDYAVPEPFGEQPQRFGYVQVRALRSIAEQVSPIIRALGDRVARERAVASIQHDMATPVVTIRDMMIRVLSDVKRERLPDEQDCRNVQTSASLLLHLVDELSEDPLALRPIQPVPTLVEGNIIARLKNMMIDRARRREIEIVFGSGFRRIPPLNVDVELMERVFHNLLTNAVKYGSPRTVARIDALAPEFDRLHYVFVVSNDGIGIEEDERELVFRPYWRSRRAQSASAVGAGLGLAIARRIVEAHGGRLELTSLRNPTAFSVFIPKRLAADVEQEAR